MSLYFLGRDAAFIGPNENQFGVLEENKSPDVGSIRGPMQFMFDTEVDRIFSTPLGAWERISFLFNILSYIA
jgi:hypothetical protein